MDQRYLQTLIKQVETLWKDMYGIPKLANMCLDPALAMVVLVSQAKEVMPRYSSANI